MRRNTDFCFDKENGVIIASYGYRIGIKTHSDVKFKKICCAAVSRYDSRIFRGLLGDDKKYLCLEYI